MAKKKAPQAPPPTPKSRRLESVRRQGVSDDRLMADLVSEGEVTNASTAMRFVEAEHGELSLTDMVASLRSHGDAINRGDLSAAERMLNAQAVALNAIFAEMARRAALHMGTVLSVAETYMRLALKAQSQSRATIETLAAVKNPPTVFARQANINNGGQQQVNNGTAPSSTRTGTRPGETLSAQTELLEERTHGSPQLDPGAAPEAIRANTRLEPLEALDRPPHP